MLLMNCSAAGSPFLPIFILAYANHFCETVIICIIHSVFPVKNEKYNFAAMLQYCELLE